MVPLALEQMPAIETDLMTMKSTGFDVDPPLLTVRAKRCGIDRNGEAGIVAVICRLELTIRFAAGMGAPSRSTCAGETKPEPKIFTPAKSIVEVSVPCGR